MAIKKCSVWQLRVCIRYCIFTALHGVAGMIGLCALQSSMACPLCEKLYPQRLHVKRHSNGILYRELNKLICHLMHFLIAKNTKNPHGIRIFRLYKRAYKNLPKNVCS